MSLGSLPFLFHVVGVGEFAGFDSVSLTQDVCVSLGALTVLFHVFCADIFSAGGTAEAGLGGIDFASLVQAARGGLASETHIALCESLDSHALRSIWNPASPETIGADGAVDGVEIRTASDAMGSDAVAAIAVGSGVARLIIGPAAI